MDSEAMSILLSKPMGLTYRWAMSSSSWLSSSSSSSLFHVVVPMRYSDPCASQNSNKNFSKPMMKLRGVDQNGRMKLASSNASYATPLEAASSPGSSFTMRPLAEILRDLNKRVPDQVLKDRSGRGDHRKYIPWYHANWMLSFYAPGWCGEVRDISFSADGNFVTVIYRVTIRGSDGEAFREASSSVSTTEEKASDPAQKAEAMAFVRACARFGLGLYLHDEEEK